MFMIVSSTSLINEQAKKYHIFMTYKMQDTSIIRDFFQKLNHRPLIDINRRTLKKKIQLIKR